MKKVNWELSIGNERLTGSIVVDDDATDRDIDEQVRTEMFDSGVAQYNWEVAEE